MDNLEIALAHAARGRRVFPLAPDTKRPLVQWTKEASTGETNIRRWWKRWPDAGVAWRLPEGLAVVDVDHPADVTVDLPDAPSQRTTRGFHRLYSTDETTIVRQGPIPGGDIKVGGKGYVKLYDADAFAGDPPRLPDVVAALREGSKDAASAPPESLTTRDDLLNYAGRLRRDGATADEILAAMLAAQASGRLYDSDESRPWTEEDLAGIARDIGSKPPGEWPRMPTVRRIRRDAEPEVPPSEVIMSMADYVAAHGDENIEWIIDGLAARGIVSLLAGPMKGGKTTLLENALRLVGGSDEFLGKWTVAPHRALLLTEEGAVTIRLNMSHLDVDVVSRRDKVPSAWTLPETVDAALWWLESNPGGLVIVDTYDKWADVRDENDNAANVAAIRAFYPIVEAGGAVLLVHHSRKGGGEYGEGIRGAGAILGAVDHAVELKHVSPGSDRRRLEMHGRVLEDTRRTLDFDRESMTYRLVDEDAEENASLLSMLDGIPTRADDPDGMNAEALGALWGLKAPRRRIEELVAGALLVRSDSMVKVGRGKEFRYWRAGVTVPRDAGLTDAPTNNRGTTDEHVARTTVRGDAP